MPTRAEALLFVTDPSTSPERLQRACEILGLDAAGAIPVYNYIHLIARSMGLAYEDEYKAWKRAGEGAAALIGPERIAAVGVTFYERAILPELKKRPKLG